jgi:rpsU-divergently transcribed protein
VKLNLLKIIKNILANELGYSNSLSALLPNGPIDLIYYTLDTWNMKLKKEIEELKHNKKNSHLSIDEKYLKALKLRLSYEIPLINTWPQAMKIGMNPQNIKSTLDRLMIMSDEICSIDDDSSIVKRTFLLKTFMITEFFKS